MRLAPSFSRRASNSIAHAQNFLVVRVAESEHGKLQVIEPRSGFRVQFRVQRTGAVGRFAVTVGTGDQKQAGNVRELTDLTLAMSMALAAKPCFTASLAKVRLSEAAVPVCVPKRIVSGRAGAAICARTEFTPFAPGAKSPARKPLSHARCSMENGALSGMNGGGVSWLAGWR